MTSSLQQESSSSAGPWPPRILRQRAASARPAPAAISLSSKAPGSALANGQWRIQDPSSSTSGVIFSPFAEAQTTSDTQFPSYARIPNSPRAASLQPRRPSLPHYPNKPSTSTSSSSSNLSKLLENTLKLESLGVSKLPPDPRLAAKVTISDRCRPDDKVIFDQEPFDTRQKLDAARRQDSSSSTRRRDTAEQSIAPSTSGTNSLSSPSSSVGVLPAVATPASSLVHEAEGSSTSATADPSSPVLARTNAWNKPRSWADLASRMGPAAVIGNTRLSENVGGTSPERASATSHADGASPARQSRSNGREKKRSKGQANGKSGPMSLASMVGQAETQFSAPLTYPRGMINKGNLCFANAILQTLVYCAPFYNLFRLLEENMPHDFTNSTPLMEAVIHFLSEFHVISHEIQRNFVESPTLAVDAIRDLKASSEPFVPEPLYHAMKLNKRFDTMRRGHQEDAEEFLGFFLDTLHEELQSAIRKSEERLRKKQQSSNGEIGGDAKGGGEGEDDIIEEREVNRPVSPVGGEGWLEVGQKGKTSFTRTTSTSHSPITRIFGGKLRSVLRTPGSRDSVTLEPYQSLQLDIQPVHVTTVEEALRNLTTPETVSGVLSSTRNLVDATKQVFIETLPPILILHLKRFVYDDVGGVQKSSKVLGYGPALEIAESVISPARRSEAKRRYKLFGIVYHHGRFATGGHYTVDVLRQDRSEWLHIDDTTWNPTSAPSSKPTAPHSIVRPSTPSSGHNAAPNISNNSSVSNGPSMTSSPKIPVHAVPTGSDGGSAYLLFYAREDAIDASSTVHGLANGSLAGVNGIIPPISAKRLADATMNGPVPVVPGASPSAHKRR